MPSRTDPPRRSSGRLASTLVLLALAGIASSLVARQLHRPAWREPVVSEVAPASVDLAPFAAPWAATGPVEHYSPATLYEKIDGQADLYLQEGFRGLTCQRFADPADPGAALELRLYTLATGAGARSVQAQQARPEALPLGEGLQGGCADGACFLALGAMYLEVLPVGAAEGRAREVALAFAAVQAAPVVRAPDLFPTEGLVAGSVVEEVQAAYGLAALDGVATASFQGIQGPLLAWIGRGGDGLARREAVRLELERLGGATHLDGDAVVVEILGSTCVIVVVPGGAAGVQEAVDPIEALSLARRLAAAIEGPAP